MEIIMIIPTIIVALITAVFGPVAVEWAKTYFSNKKGINSVSEAIQINALVDEQLEIIQDELECDRIWVAQFHNGGHFYPTGKSIQKFSIFYEKSNPNLPPFQQYFQSVPVSLFPKAMAELYKNGEINVSESSGEDYGLKVFSDSYNAKSYYLISLGDLHDRFICMLCICYSQKYELSKEEWIFIRQKAGVIGTLIDGYLNKKK